VAGEKNKRQAHRPQTPVHRATDERRSNRATGPENATDNAAKRPSDAFKTV